ncbi:MAG: hypothetical protein G01um101425_187 [Candidatus Peregrinibacteria bacterium Gr01-1014_25]|nr:MAG: hypothetical protein G01um101425_187 [Candidatus Peregrinibacteria bacterium Gr01-1014_25]
MSLSAAFPNSAMAWFSDGGSVLLLFLTAIPVGVFAVIIGASQFVSIPIFQLFFPQMSLGGIIGNLRIGNMVRDAVALIPVRHDVRLRSMLKFIVAVCAGSVIGTVGIADVPQTFLLPILLFAVAITEAAPWISRHMHRHALVFALLLTGIYYGVIGAGGSVITMAFLRVHFPRDEQIHSVRVHMLLLELLAFIVSVGAFAVAGEIDWAVSIVWGAGAVIGGFIGGKLLRHIGKTSPASQKFWMRAVAAIAIAVSAWRVLR